LALDRKIRPIRFMMLMAVSVRVTVLGWVP